MHDRRIDGEPAVFGNAGTLYMRAMTWWDHGTESIWSQPLGRAIEGPLAGTELELLPSQVTTWRQWRLEHPGTRVMINDTDRVRLLRQGFDEDFVIGVALEEGAKAFDYRAVASAGVINDFVGSIPVVVWAEDANFGVYLRQGSAGALTFVREGGGIVDQETGSGWDLAHGLAIRGPLEGETLQPLPSLTSYDWAWRDFYPGAEIVGK